MLVLLSGESAPLASNDVRQGCIFLPFMHTSPLPLVCQLLAYLDTLDALINPSLAIPQAPVVNNCLLNTQLGVLHLVEALAGHLSHPLFERLSLR